MKLNSYTEFLNEGKEDNLSVTLETLQKKKELEGKRDELVKKLKEAGEKDDTETAKMARLQIKKIDNQIEILMIDAKIKEMSEKK